MKGAYLNGWGERERERESTSDLYHNYIHVMRIRKILISYVKLDNTVRWVIFVGSNFHGKSEKALKINFRGFKFRDSKQSRGVALLHKQ